MCGNSSSRTPNEAQTWQRPEVNSAGKFLFVLMGCKASAEQLHPSGCFIFILFFLSYFRKARNQHWHVEDGGALNVFVESCPVLVSLSAVNMTGISLFILGERGTEWENIHTLICC